MKDTLNKLAKFFSYGCIHCGKAVMGKNQVLCSVCEYRMKSTPFPDYGKIVSGVSYSAPEAKNLIYYMKSNNDPYVFNYAAKLIASKFMEKYPLDSYADFKITYAPRNPITLFKNRFDQSREIAGFLAIHLFNDEDRVVSLFKRYPFSTEQKNLNSDNRQQNALDIFSLKDNAVIPEKVIIVDDVTTTGATLFSLRELLLAAGVKECILCTVAANC